MTFGKMFSPDIRSVEIEIYGEASSCFESQPVCKHSINWMLESQLKSHKFQKTNILCS